MDYLIRNATARDIPSITRLAQESSTAAQWTDQQYENLIAQDQSSPARLILVATEEGNSAILGFLVARHTAGEWDLENIVVAPENRGRGIGTALVGELLSRAQTSNSESVFLEVRESNLAARALYRKLGFEESGSRKGYYSNPPEVAVLYRKTLEKQSTTG